MDSNSNWQAGPEQEDWVYLFDGETLNGWHTYGKKTVEGDWKVEDGILLLDKSGKEGSSEELGDLVTDAEYANFHLRLEWKMPERGNSGILFYVQEDPVKYTYTWMSGPEVQLLDNERHPDANIPKRRAGDLYDLIESRHATVHPAGEWNQTEIICNNGKLELYLNNTLAISTTLWDDNWERLISESKFKSIDGFGTFRSGKIALQDHRDVVWFRNIMIRKL